MQEFFQICTVLNPSDKYEILTGRTPRVPKPDTSGNIGSK
jgi:hypothetical protein